MVIGCNTRRQGAWRPVNRGDAQGGFQRSVLKPLLWGEPPAFGGVGGTLPPRLSPGGGNGKGGDSNSLLPQAITGGPTPEFVVRRPTPASSYSHLKAGIPRNLRWPTSKIDHGSHHDRPRPSPK